MIQHDQILPHCYLAGVSLAGCFADYPLAAPFDFATGLEGKTTSALYVSSTLGICKL